MCHFLPCRSTAALGAMLEAGEISQGPHIRACLPMVNSPCFFATTAVCTLAIGPCIQFTPVHWHILLASPSHPVHTHSSQCPIVTAGDWLCHMSHQSRLRDTF